MKERARWVALRADRELERVEGKAQQQRPRSAPAPEGAQPPTLHPQGQGSGDPLKLRVSAPTPTALLCFALSFGGPPLALARSLARCTT